MQNKPKESRFKKRKQQEEKMIADAVFDDSNQSKKKKKKQPHDVLLTPDASSGAAYHFRGLHHRHKRTRKRDRTSSSIHTGLRRPRSKALSHRVVARSKARRPAGAVAAARNKAAGASREDQTSMKTSFFKTDHVFFDIKTMMTDSLECGLLTIFSKK